MKEIVLQLYIQGDEELGSFNAGNDVHSATRDVDSQVRIVFYSIINISDFNFSESVL